MSERDPARDHGPEPAGIPESWTAWEAALVDSVLRLPDGAAVVVSASREHARSARPRGSRLRWLVGARRTSVVPSARLVRVEDHLRGHWSGSERSGGFFPWTAEEEDAILALGWHPPTVGDGEDFVKFWPDDVPSGPYLPLEDARRAVAVVGATFRTVVPGDDSPDSELPRIAPGIA